MLTGRLLLLIAVFFFTSMISVVTGSTSLITVPAMIACGIEAHAAVATNMLALIFLSAGGSLPFARRGTIARHYLPGTIFLTIAGSALGALFLVKTPVRALSYIIAIAMLSMAIWAILKRDHIETESPRAQSQKIHGYVVTFLLAIYGGFFSGGYVTLLTAAFVVFFGLTFIQSIATTKVVNLFSSAIAALVFAWHGIVDYKLGMVLGITMFFGALVGGNIALRVNRTWLRSIFVIVTLGLALRMLLHPL